MYISQIEKRISVNLTCLGDERDNLKTNLLLNCFQSKFLPAINQQTRASTSKGNQNA